MEGELIFLITKVWRGVKLNIRWMSWNLFLAFVPFVLSFWLFRRQQSRSLLWWICLLVFFAFLPNAPYVLTDVIHMIQAIRKIESAWLITLVVIPGYALYMLVGFEAYVLSLINLGYYLNKIGLRRWVLPAELVIHVLSAIGIYVGRFLRFNSWDLVTQPDILATEVIYDLTGKIPIVIIAITFCIVGGLYWVMKKVTLAVILRQQINRQKKQQWP